MAFNVRTNGKESIACRFGFQFGQQSVAVCLPVVRGLGLTRATFQNVMFEITSFDPEIVHLYLGNHSYCENEMTRWIPNMRVMGVTMDDQFALLKCIRHLVLHYIMDTNPGKVCVYSSPPNFIQLYNASRSTLVSQLYFINDEPYAMQSLIIIRRDTWFAPWPCRLWAIAFTLNLLTLWTLATYPMLARVLWDKLLYKWTPLSQNPRRRRIDQPATPKVSTVVLTSLQQSGTSTRT